jgi:vacuolar-type H+-ATPase subunit D/Vma8
MKKIVILFILFVLVFSSYADAQNGRPAPIVNNSNAPIIGVRNENDPTKIELAKITERLNVLESRVALLETDNASLKTQNASYQKQISDLSVAQNANYKVLDYSLSQLNKKFNSQVGTFKITGFIGSKTLAILSPVHLLFGVRE